MFKIFFWKMPKITIEHYKRSLRTLPLSGRTIHCSSCRYYDYLVRIKDFFGNKNPVFYGFVNGAVLLDSSAIYNMKKFIQKKGGYCFSELIRIAPFEMQWYGEYIMANEKYSQHEGLFTLVNSPNECVPEEGWKNHFGICFQSQIYDYSELQKESISNTSIIYKRPTHCAK